MNKTQQLIKSLNLEIFLLKMLDTIYQNTRK